MPSETINRTEKGDLGTLTIRTTVKGKPVTQTTWTQYDSKNTYASRSGSRTPGYHSPLREGRLAPLPYEMSETITSYKSGFRNTESARLSPLDVGYEYTQLQGCMYGSVGQFGNVGPGKDDSLIGRLSMLADQALLRKAKDTSANLAMAAASVDKTFRTVGDAAIAIGGAITNLRHGNFAGAAAAVGINAPRRASSRFRREYARNAGQAAARGWLALQYGWKPLLNDVYGAVDELARHQRDAIIATVRTSREQKTPQNYSKLTKTGQMVYIENATGSRSTKVQVAVTFYRPNDARRTAKDTGLLNPAVVVWDLVPWSFVVDWFLPIGAWLDTFDATAGLTFKSGYRTVFHRGECTWRSSSFGIDNYGMKINESYSSAQSYIYMKRTVLSGFPSIGYPAFKNPTSVTHAANGLALLAGLFRK